jgi:hypothetical protein
MQNTEYLLNHLVGVDFGGNDLTSFFQHSF